MTRTRTLTPMQAAVLGALDDTFRTPGGLIRTGLLDPQASPLATWRAAQALTARGLAEKGDADGIPRNTGYRRPPVLEALRADLAAAGATAESPLELDPEAEQMARQERWTEQ